MHKFVGARPRGNYTFVLFDILFRTANMNKGMVFMETAFEPRNCKVALLSGGTSGEREISIASGKSTSKALMDSGFQVTNLDPSNKEDLKTLIDGDFDVAFLVLHGRKGEDGVIQGFLDLIDLPYTGSGVWSSSTAMNKARSKVFYRQEGIPTPQSVTIRKDIYRDPSEIIDLLGEKCVVKPSTEGSSLGVFIVEGREQLAKAMNDVFEYDDQALVERYVKGRELTVAVLGNDDPDVLPVIEIVPKNDSYDFESKYQPGGSEHICPANLPEEVALKVQDYAKRAHKALSCAGVSRSDFLVEEDGSCWILETNTLPGMTSTSLLPDAARAVGISFEELCTLMVKNALGAE